VKGIRKRRIVEIVDRENILGYPWENGDCQEWQVKIKKKKMTRCPGGSVVADKWDGEQSYHQPDGERFKKSVASHQDGKNFWNAPRGLIVARGKVAAKKNPEGNKIRDAGTDTP